MTERERLYELIVDAENEFYREKPCGTDSARCEMVAEHLLANGVLLPPVKVGQTVYYIVGATYKSPENCRVSTPREVVEISYKRQRGPERRTISGFITEDGVRYGFNSIGKTAFLAREDAEEALRKRKEVQKE